MLKNNNPNKFCFNPFDCLFNVCFYFQPGKGSKKAKKSGSNIFALFSQKQIQEFKEAFGIIDVDKDGIITQNDLKAAFAAIGRPVSDAEANNMVGEAPGPINFTQMVTLFAEKMAGGECECKNNVKIGLNGFFYPWT